MREAESIWCPTEHQEATQNSTNTIISDAGAQEAEKLCLECRSIDFNKIFARNVDEYRNGRAVCSIGHISRMHSDCALCQFFLCALCESDRDFSIKPLLVVSSARRYFRLPRNFVLDFPVLFAIKPRWDPRPNTLYRIERCVTGYKGHILRAFILRLQSERFRSIARQIQPYIDYDMVKSWLGFCASNHSKLCTTGSLPSISGFRVIDCSSRQIILWDQRQHDEYVTLSYIWGATSEEFASNCNILPQKLPLLIEDSFRVTQNLGFKYLWIDRYCVPQHDSLDKHIQIQNMGVIYQHSALTLIAASSRSPLDGLPGVSYSCSRPQPHIQIGEHNLFISYDVEYEVRNSNWNTRGWTYQEGLRSRRRLVFTRTQVYFQCTSMCCAESLDIPLSSLHTADLQRFRDDIDVPMAFPRREVGRKLDDLPERIKEYSTRAFTFKRDRLDAFKGILAVFENMKPPIGNLLGLPLYPAPSKMLALTAGLSWVVHSFKKGDVRRLNTFPSWTWLGWEFRSEIPWLYFVEFYEFRTFQSSITDINVELKNGITIPWEGSGRHTLKRSTNSDSVACLHISGWIGMVRVPASESPGISWEDKSAMPLTTLAIRGGAVTRSAMHLEIPTIQLPEGRYYEFSVVILGYSNIHTFVMILTRSDGDESFERLNTVRVHYSIMSPNWRDDPLAHVKSLGFTLRKIRIR